jgi:rhodanese-related sulfurtransferase
MTKPSTRSIALSTSESYADALLALRFPFPHVSGDTTSDLTTSSGLAERLHEVQIVDCREPDEWEAGRIEGSIHVPLNSILAGAVDQLDPKKETVVVCRSGNRSELGALMLQARGFTAHNLERGLEEWAAEGRPLSTPEGQPGRVA